MRNRYIWKTYWPEIGSSIVISVGLIYGGLKVWEHLPAGDARIYPVGQIAQSFNQIAYWPLLIFFLFGLIYMLPVLIWFYISRLDDRHERPRLIAFLIFFVLTTGAYNWFRADLAVQGQVETLATETGFYRLAYERAFFDPEVTIQDYFFTLYACDPAGWECVPLLTQQGSTTLRWTLDMRLREINGQVEIINQGRILYPPR